MKLPIRRPPLLRGAKNVELAQALPPRLLKFFAHNPPRPSLDGSRAVAPSEKLPSDTTTPESSASTLVPKRKEIYYNPFLPHKNPKTGAWHPPIYSLRRQAELVKLARAHDVEELLPFTIKGTEYKAMKQEEHGLRVKGTGVGQRVKGHAWERSLKGRLEKRRQAMLDMPRMVQEWKRLGHGRGITKWPSGRAGK